MGHNSSARSLSKKIGLALTHVRKHARVVASVVSNVPEFGGGRAIDLSQLSEAERHVLRLLGQGHTAKSIARTLGSSPTAINERLRQARRKTGVGSSREVARLLTAQENRDEKIELAFGSDERSPESWVSENRFRPRWLGATVMIIAVVAALSIATYGIDQLRAPAALNNEAIIDPIVGRIPPSTEFGIDKLYLRLRAEKRDTSWAPGTEQALRGYLNGIRYVGRTGEPFRVTCGSTLCEAAGVIDAPMTVQSQASSKSPVNRTMQALQGKDIHDYATSMDLELLGSSFQSPDPKSAPKFLIYFQRKH